MKFSQASLLALLLPAASARFIEDNESNRVGLYTEWAKEVDEAATKYHIELAPGDTRWVTEDEKWELRRVSGSIHGIRSHSLRLLSERILYHGILCCLPVETPTTSHPLVFSHNRAQSRMLTTSRGTERSTILRYHGYARPCIDPHKVQGCLSEEAHAAGRDQPAPDEPLQDRDEGSPHDLHWLSYTLLQV